MTINKGSFGAVHDGREAVADLHEAIRVIFWSIQGIACVHTQTANMITT